MTEHILARVRRQLQAVGQDLTDQEVEQIIESHSPEQVCHTSHRVYIPPPPSYTSAKSILCPYRVGPR